VEECEPLGSGKPPAFRRIRSNVYTRRAPHKFSLDDVVVCSCDPSLGDTCSDDACLNALTNVECDEKRCPCGEACANQRFRQAPTRPGSAARRPLSSCVPRSTRESSPGLQLIRTLYFEGARCPNERVHAVPAEK
jgi:hypothetical protein